MHTLTKSALKITLVVRSKYLLLKSEKLATISKVMVYFNCFRSKSYSLLIFSEYIVESENIDQFFQKKREFREK